MLSKIQAYYQSESQRVNPEKYFLFYVILISFFVWIITTLRAVSTGITYDEAFTYIIYSKSIFGFLRLHLANNHPINSLLIYLTSQISGLSYNEFVIRLPNLLAFSVYLFISYKVSKYFRYPFFTFSILVLNYYLNEFFGLARGYGLSTTFVLISIYIYLLNRTAEKNLLFSLFFLTLASATIYSNLVIIVCFVIYVIFVDIRLPNLLKFVKRNLFYLISFGLIWLYLAYSFRTVSAEGLPLFGHLENDFFKAVPLSFAGMFTRNEFRKIILAMIGAIVLFAGFATQFRQIQKIPFTMIILSTLLLTYLIATILQKPLPTERVLLPYYPILALAICEIIPLLVDIVNTKVAVNLVNIGLVLTTILLVVNYVLSTNINSTLDWNNNYPLRDTVYLSVIHHEPPANVGHWTVIFYIQQMEERYGFSLEEIVKSP